MVVSGTKSSWRSVTSSGPQGPIVGLILLKIFISDLVGGAESTPGNFQAIQSCEERLIHQMVVLPFQRRPGRQENWAEGTS